MAHTFLLMGMFVIEEAKTWVSTSHGIRDSGNRLILVAGGKDPPEYSYNSISAKQFGFFGFSP